MARLIEVQQDVLYDPLIKYRTPNIDDYVQDLNCNEVVIKFLKKLKIRRGDVVHFDQFGDYRNDGKLIWTGSELMALSSDIDDYGSVPSDFTLEEFDDNKNYFKESINHNCYVWIEGWNYKIIAKQTLQQIGNTPIYWYSIQDDAHLHKWHIITSWGENKFQNRALALGLFEAESDIELGIKLTNSERILFGIDLKDIV